VIVPEKVCLLWAANIAAEARRAEARRHVSRYFIKLTQSEVIRNLREIGGRCHTPPPDSWSKTPAHLSSRRERVAWAVALGLGVAFVGTGAAWLTRPAPAPASDANAWRSFTQLTDLSGVEDTPAISPDGTTVAFSRLVDGSWDLFVQRIGGRTATPVAGDPDRDERWPAFAPDSQTIAFLRRGQRVVRRGLSRIKAVALTWDRR
jgi:hypothetical protein